MQIIDCHVHPRPQTENYQKNIDELIMHMAAHGISSMIASDLGEKWQAFPDHAMLEKANSRMRQASLRLPGKLYYLVYINPQLDNWQELLTEHAGSAVGVKLWISLHDGSGDLARSKDVLRAAAKANLPVLIHTFELTGGVVGGAIGIEGIIELAQAVPECMVIAAHSCGNWRKAIARKADFPANIFFDISGGYPERTMVERLTAAFGSERILYGSDAYGRSFASQLSKVFDSDISEKDKENILHLNTERIFKLPPAENLSAVLKVWNIKQEQEDHYCFIGKSEYFDHDVTAEELLEAAGSVVTSLFTASMDVFAAPDKIQANDRFRREVKAFEAIKPLAAVDLRNLPEALAQLENIDGFAGIWISPYVHDYPLEYLPYKEFFDRCAVKNIPIWINLELGDRRFRSEKLSGKAVPADDVKTFAGNAPVNRYVIQSLPQLEEMSKILPEYFLLECSRLSDGEYSPETFFKNGNVDKLRYGSEYPFRYFQTVRNCLQGRY